MRCWVELRQQSQEQTPPQNGNPMQQAPPSSSKTIWWFYGHVCLVIAPLPCQCWCCGSRDMLWCANFYFPSKRTELWLLDPSFKYPWILRMCLRLFRQAREKKNTNRHTCPAHVGEVVRCQGTQAGSRTGSWWDLITRANGSCLSACAEMRECCKWLWQ